MLTNRVMLTRNRSKIDFNPGLWPCVTDLKLVGQF